MKVCIVQPPYSTDFSQSEKYFAWEMEAFDKCDESMDLIVFPESSEVPCMAHSSDNLRESFEKFFDRLLRKAQETAKRCNAVVFFNAHDKRENCLYNTTFAIDRSGKLVGTYDKQHLTPKEVAVYGVEGGYSFEHSAPTVIEIDGLRYCFLTCYDFYFYEAFPTLARVRPDIIIGCSHQRSDKQSALMMMSQFCAYNCNAYVVRASVSMGENTDIGGGSCIVAPDGSVLADMKSRVGLECADIDPTKKYYKPAGFGNPDAAHWEYIEAGRRPWKYRPAGSAIVKHDALMPYPRICANGGLVRVAPKNSLLAIGAAVSMGSDEIKLDLWWTRDGEIVALQDCRLESISNGTGFVYDYTLEELKKLDFGMKFGEEYEGLQILTLEEILKKYGCHIIMDLHIKTLNNTDEYDEGLFRKIVDLIEKYDCRKWVYLTSANVKLLEMARRVAPDITRCVEAGDTPYDVIERALKYDCKKILLSKGFLNDEMIEKAHENGIVCNLYFSDDPDEAETLIARGIDTVITNDYNRIARRIKSKK